MITRQNLVDQFNANNSDEWDEPQTMNRQVNEFIGLVNAVTAVIAKDVMTAGRTTETLKVEKMLYCFLEDAENSIIEGKPGILATEKKSE
jgi:hypothetical protein